MLPPTLKARILREFERWQLVVQQTCELEAQRAREIRTDPSPQSEQTRRLMDLKGIGANGAVAVGSRVLRLATDLQPPRAGGSGRVRESGTGQISCCGLM